MLVSEIAQIHTIFDHINTEGQIPVLKVLLVTNITITDNIFFGINE